MSKFDISVFVCNCMEHSVVCKSMKSRSFLVFCCLIQLLTATNGSKVNLIERGYENLVISVDPTVSGEDCPTLINSLKALIAETSSALCVATASRAYFKSVNILVARTDADKCGAKNRTAWARFHKSDVQVGIKHPVSDDGPIAFPYAGCGHPTLPIHLPVGYVTQQENKNRGRELLRQWIHYRYGVFDETGAHNDPVYPVGYAIPGKAFEANSCTDKPMNGSWAGSPSCTLNPTPHCNWTVLPESNADIRTSMMYRNDFPNVNKLCTAGNHKAEAPNKHNFYCDGRSAEDVVLSHYDFNGVNASGEPCQQPEFNLISFEFNGYFIILDRTSSMSAKNYLKYATESLAQFLWYLPDGVIVYLMTFAETFEWILNGTALNSTIKRNTIAKLDQLLPSTSDTNDSLGPALLEAASVTSQVLDVIVITAASREPLNASEVLSTYGTNKITAHVLSLGLGTPSAFLHELASRGLHTLIPVQNPVDPMRFDVNGLRFTTGVLQTIYSQTFLSRNKVFEAGHYVGPNQTVNGSFLVDSTGSQLIFVFTSLSPETVITLRDENSVLYTVKAIAGAKFRRTDPITTFTAGSTWTYSVENAADAELTLVYVDVWIENPPTENSVVARAWTNAVGNNTQTLTKQPVVIYSQFLQNQKPLEGITPVAKVYVADERGETILLREVLLKDAGGPFDVTEGDGIFSGSLAPFFGIGMEYSIVVEARGQSARTCQVYTGNPSASSKIVHDNCNPIGSFQRYLYEAGFHITPDFNSSVDQIPPDRIRDLALIQLNSAGNAGTLKWTAPLDDSGFGLQVNNFTVTAQAEGRDPIVIQQGSILPTTGSTVFYSFILPADFNSSVALLRVHSTDMKGNTSPASNIVSLFVPSEPTSVPNSPRLDWIDYALLGISCILAVALIIALIFLCCGVRCCCSQNQVKGKNKDEVVDHPENLELELDTQQDPNFKQLRRGSRRVHPESNGRAAVPVYAVPEPVVDRRTQGSSRSKSRPLEDPNLGFVTFRDGTRNSQVRRVPLKDHESFCDPRFVAKVATNTTFGYATVEEQRPKDPIYVNLPAVVSSPRNPLPRPVRTAPQTPAVRPRSSLLSPTNTQALVVNLNLDMLESIV